MEYRTITCDVAEGIATIALNRPDHRNGFTVTMADELAAALTAVDTDDDVRVVVLTGNGDHFCVGMDMTGGSIPEDDPSVPGWVEPATRVARPMYQLTKPVIAAVHGAAVGVGATMLLPADFRLAAEDARFGFVFSRRGLFPEGGSLWFLPRIVGLAKAKEWMVSGRVFDAHEALAAGLVSAVYSPDDLFDRTYELARDIVRSTAPVSVAVIRRALVEVAAAPSPETAFALDGQLVAHASTSSDLAEGVASFIDKRPPRFPGRVSTDLPGFLPWLQASPRGDCYGLS
ncbi:enoyl-CoA hydratase-related protein [Antrihabitans stalactiti]|uniref:Enoyl-CoA hydratase n=1 Tax=Antrihabitans stalactiti TaxID=2584121 RepID=A0A848KFI6_9NOCA|nr:enoyl-CoA hydratase-related protein [Antrihabitans stalactiti]NMN95894.1 enoyl-CoA hydratase [Antrihabitans stalactiti]